MFIYVNVNFENLNMLICDKYSQTLPCRSPVYRYNPDTDLAISSAPRWNKISDDEIPITTPSMLRVQGSDTRCSRWKQDEIHWLSKTMGRPGYLL